TGDYLSGRREIQIPPTRRPVDKDRMVTVEKAVENNLRDVTVSVPLGVLTAVTGVSGSGKSTLINEIIYTQMANVLNSASRVPGRNKRVTGLENLDKVVHVDQWPNGRAPRSNPATYKGGLDHVHRLLDDTKAE